MNPNFSKILMPLSILGIIISIGFTLSYFQDAETSGNNVFEAGTLDLNLNKEGGEEANIVWKAENWLPGDEVSGELELKNNGSLPIESLLMSVEIE